MYVPTRISGSTANLLAVYAHADAATRHAGRTWYPQAHATAGALANLHGVTLYVAAAVIAALSPSIAWETNVAAAATVLAAVQAGAATARISGYNVNRERAFYIARTGDVTALVGPKVTAFYHNIAYPELAGPVTIDRHMLRAWLAWPGSGLLNCRPPTYARAQADFIAAAEDTGMLPHHFQATLWLAVKRTRTPGG